MAKIIGCDLGTTNSVIAIKQGDVKVLQSRENHNSIPSVVGSHKDQIIVGSLAVDRMAGAPDNTIVSIKRLMGRAFRDPEVERVRSRYLYKVVSPSEGTDDDLRVILGGKQYSPIEVSSQILKKVKEDAELRLNDNVEFAVITVPAYFTDKQRDATRKAGQMAGLKVQKILDEPTAAAIAFGADNVGPNDAANILVYDLGGGTFDISVLTVVGPVFAQLAIQGDMWLGGDDFDHKIMDYVVNHVKNEYDVDAGKNKRFLIELKKRAEQAKMALSGMAHTDINVIGMLQDKDNNLIDVELELTRAQFEDMIRPDVERSIELVKSAIANASMTVDEIDHVLLVGGSSCIPLVRKSLVAVFGERKVRMDVDAMKCVAYGAAVLAARLGERVECSKGHINPGTAVVCGECGEHLSHKSGGLIIGSVTSQDYGIEVMDETTKDKFEPIIPKGSSYPSPKPVVRTFKVPSPGVRRMKIRVFAGSNPVASKNELQVTVWMELPPNVAAGTPMDVALALDGDCIIERVKVSLKDGSGREIEVFPDRGGEGRSRLEKKLEAVRRNWDKARAKADGAAIRAVESIYDEVIRAANQNKLDDAERKLQEMKKEVDKTEQTLWKKKALNLINYSQYALNEFGLAIDAQQTARVRRYVDELQIEIDNSDEAAAAEKYIQLDKETDAFPAAVVTMLRINSAVFLAQQAGNLGAADRIRAGYNEIVGAFKRQDYTAVNVKIQEIVPLVNQFANVPVPDLTSIDVVPIK